MQFGIRSIPTLLIFKNGKVVDQIVGAVPKHALADKISKHLN
jgi:thioredoxin 1